MQTHDFKIVFISLGLQVHAPLDTRPFNMVCWRFLWRDDTRIHHISRSLAVRFSSPLMMSHAFFIIWLREGLLNQSRICKFEALELIVNYLGTYRGEVQEELDATIGGHARFSYLGDLYKYYLVAAVEDKVDEEWVLFYRQCALRLCFLYLVDTIIFVEKNTTYVNVVYVTYFTNLERIHEYNRDTYLVYMYSKVHKTPVYRSCYHLTDFAFSIRPGPFFWHG